MGRQATLAVLLGAITSLVAYWALGYIIPRSDSFELILAYLFLFIPYLHWCWIAPPNKYRVLGMGLIFRLALLAATPALTDDFYRFFWDGTLSIHGFHPFDFKPSELPTEILHASGLQPQLFDLLNSPNYYTVYPPLLQGVFAGAAWLAHGDLQVFLLLTKGLNIGFEILTWWALSQLLEHFKLPVSRLALYFLNPLIILELNGNLHYEVAMISFLSLAAWCLVKQRPLVTGLLVMLATATKLYPVLFAPLFFFQFAAGKRWVFMGSYLLSTAAVFLAFFSWDQFLHMKESVDLYFESFEFNAGIYYVVRWVGYQIWGFNIGYVAGSVLGVISLTLICCVYWHNRLSEDIQKAIASFFIITALYYGLSTTVMPWYLSGILAFSIFTRFKFPVVWSALAVFSYVAYATDPVAENLWLIATEYLAVMALLLVELKWARQQKRLTN